MAWFFIIRSMFPLIYFQCSVQAVFVAYAGVGIVIRPGLVRLLYGVGKLVKFGLHAGNMNFNTQNEE